MLQNMQLEESYHRNRKRNGNPSHFYQGQYKQPKEITRYMTRNY